jgi:hypothetical protein
MLASGKGILKTAREPSPGSSVVQRNKAEMARADNTKCHKLRIAILEIGFDTLASAVRDTLH